MIYQERQPNIMTESREELREIEKKWVALYTKESNNQLQEILQGVISCFMEGGMILESMGAKGIKLDTTPIQELLDTCIKKLTKFNAMINQYDMEQNDNEL